jgi:TetR/AcrR family transcriptional regulator, regulator of cefoperazone and chloramphenicol sensitivity
MTPPPVRTVENVRGEETRQRLLDTAIRLFAANGFNNVTVREISRDADVNLAAINYHFGDKFALYMAVVRTAANVMWNLNDLSMQPATVPAEQRLRHYIRAYIPRLMTIKGPGAWIFRLMQHEQNEPTEAAPWIVDNAIRPRLRYLASVVADLLDLPVDDLHVFRCAISIHTQCLAVMPHPFRALIDKDWKVDSMSDGAIDAAVDHITMFSLAGIRAVREIAHPGA